LKSFNLPLRLLGSMVLCAGAGIVAQSVSASAPHATPPAAHHRKIVHGAKGKSKGAASPAPAAAVAPKSAAEVQTALLAEFKTGKLAADTIHVAMQDKVITLTGTVHRAESKGVAIREARQVAKQSGWTDFHVNNRLDVQP